MKEGNRLPFWSAWMRRGYGLLIPIILVFAGCSVHPSNNLNAGRVTNFKGCALPKEQGRLSLHGQWGQLPIPLVFDRDFYVTDGGAALPSLRGAIGSWNVWAQLRGKSGAFNLVNDSTGTDGGRDIPDLNDCAQASYTASVPDVVGIWKISGAGTHSNRRDSCGTSSTGGPGKLLSNAVQGATDWTLQNGRIVSASVLLNFDDYNSPGKQRTDLESLLLHELGHVLGLLHSCNGGGVDTTGAPACFEGGVLNVPPLFADAVMFPFLQPNQQRRNLQQNDYNRINCLY